MLFSARLGEQRALSSTSCFLDTLFVRVETFAHLNLVKERGLSDQVSFSFSHLYSELYLKILLFFFFPPLYYLFSFLLLLLLVSASFSFLFFSFFRCAFCVSIFFSFRELLFLASGQVKYALFNSNGQ